MNSSQTQKFHNKESIFIIGYVFSVEGRKVRIKVNKNKNSSHLLYNGQVLKNVSVGGYVKIAKGFVEIIGKVEGEHIEVERRHNEKYSKEENKIVRYLEISLFGHFDGEKFEQGIKEMPLIDNKCYLLDKDEFNRLHQFYKKTYDKALKAYKDAEPTILIGSLTEEPSQEIKVSANKLFASHIGIFGNTGSGKSNTLARVYHELFHQMEGNENFKNNSKFLIIDFNGEYGKRVGHGEKDKIITEGKKVYHLDTRRATGGDKIPINEKDLLDVELVSILANATDKTQKPFIRRSIDFYKKIYENATPPEALEHFKNILRRRLIDIFQMVIKEKSHTLRDYVKIILGIDDDESIDSPEWNNTHSHFMSPTPPSRQIKDRKSVV